MYKRGSKPVRMSSSRADGKSNESVTVSWDHIPSWLQDNKHTLTGYRPPNPSYLGILTSLTFLHNQTCNVYTHLVGAAMVPPCAYAFFKLLSLLKYEGVNQNDYIVLGIFFASAELCLLFSAIFHLFLNHSPRVHDFWHQADLLGIVILTFGTFVPGIYYLFYCEPILQLLHWALITASSLFTTIFICVPKYRTLVWRKVRVSAYVALGLSALIPLFHGTQRYGLDYMLQHSGLSWYLWEGLFYITGVGLYGSRTPERFAPGSFDIWGSSHQIFHVFIVFAIGCHTLGLLQAFTSCHTLDMCRIKRKIS